MRIATLSSLLLVGCIAPSSTPTLDSDPDEGVDPVTPTTAIASGTYTVRSQVDLTVEAVLPESAYSMVGTLRDFSTNPARTLFDVAQDAGVPAVSELRDALPAALESKLEGWINGEIATLTLDGVPVTQLAATLAALAETSLTTFAIDSTLAIAGPTGTHTLTAIDFTPAGFDTRIALSALPATVIAATATCSSRDGSLAIGDHRYAIAYGTYAWQALEQHVTAEYGASIRDTLGAAVSCPALATRIANKCVLGVCVGHASALTAICERGLDEVVARAQDKFEALRFDALRFEAGQAQISADGARLAGVWTAELDASQGLRPVPATFTASK